MIATRRVFLKRLLWAGVAASSGTAVYGACVEPHHVVINRIPVPVPGLPEAFHGLTIAHLSDLHRSRPISAEYLDYCIEEASALEPDLIAFTGDYLTTGETRNHPGSLVYGGRELGAGFLTDLTRSLCRAKARHGVFATLGNHDHWYDGNEVSRAITEAGITVLRNRAVTLPINGLCLPVVGLEDYWAGGIDLDGAFRGVRSPFVLVLMHNPDLFETWPLAGSQLILSGHTHGGQVNLPLMGPPIVPSRYGRKYAHGLFQRGEASMYVTSGIGMVQPAVRINCPPEIALLRLERV